MAEAQAAIDSALGSTLLEQTVQCDYAFVRPPPLGPRKGRGGRDRSASLRREPRDTALRSSPDPSPSGPRKGRGGRDKSATPPRKPGDITLRSNPDQSGQFSYDFTDFIAGFEKLST